MMNNKNDALTINTLLALCSRNKEGNELKKKKKKKK